MLSSTAYPDYSGKSRLAGKTFLQTLFFFLLVTQMCFAQWESIGLEDKCIKEIAARNSNIFAMTSDREVYRSTDSGVTWSQIVDSNAVDIAISPSGSIFMIKDYLTTFWPDSLYRSSNNGNTWVNLNIIDQLPYSPLNITVSPAGFVYCGLVTGSLSITWVFDSPPPWGQTALGLSSDDGLTWTSPGLQIFGGELFDFRGQCVITSGCFRFGDFTTGYVYLSSDSGQNWLLLGNTISGHNNVLSMCLNGNILTGSYDVGWFRFLFLSSDSCKTWTQVSTLIPNAGLSIESGGMLLGTDSVGVFLFSDNGDSIGSRNDGLSNLTIHTFTMDNNGYVYTGTDDGVWRRPLSEITSVEEIPIPLPSSYILSQNYPNPFNPSTTFRYSIPSESKVIIKVYDILGKEIETLINEEKPAGEYEVEFNGANLSSGIYFYQLRAGSFIETKKMVLIR